MSKCQALRALVNERLAVAAEEIFSLIEKTIAEYEQELCRSNEENHRKQQQLENLCPRVKLFRAEVHIPSLNPSDNNLNQEITEIIQTKEEPEEPSVKQEEDLQPVTLHESSGFRVKIEESLLLQQRQIDHREETRGEDICSKLHNTEPSSDIDEDWEPPFSCLDVQMDSCMVAQSSDPPLKFHSAPLETSAAVNNGAISEKYEETERKYQCSICEKRFKTKQHLQVHTRVHTGEKPYRCLVCEKTFAHKGSLVIHRRIHTGEKPFSCLLCNSSYGHKGYLQNHMRIHTGEKPYTCVVCGKSFSQKTNLEVHKRTHTGEKPYSCHICNSTFSQKTHRDTHMRTFHTAE